MLRALALVICLAGCAGPGPRIEVVEASPGASSAEAVRIDLALQVSNPGSEPLRLETFEYDLMVAGRRVYHGRHSAQATLSGGAQRRLSIPAVIPEPQQRSPAIEYEVRGSLQYLRRDRLAEILFDTRLSRPRAAFAGQGRVELPPVPGS